MVLPTKVTKILPITTAALSSELKKKPYYMYEEEYTRKSASLMARRINNKRYKYKLYINQKGRCACCKESMQYHIDDRDGQGLELNHKTMIGIAYKGTKKEHKKAIGMNNIELVHKGCHEQITSKQVEELRKIRPRRA